MMGATHVVLVLLLCTARGMEASYPAVGRLCQQAGVLLGKGQVEAAFKLYEAALEDDEQSPDAHAHYAVALAGQQRHTESLRHFREAARLSPRNSIFNANAAQALARAGQLAAALKHQYRAVRNDPGNAQYYLRAARILSDMGNDQNAAKYLKKYVSMQPQHVVCERGLR